MARRLMHSAVAPDRPAPHPTCAGFQDSIVRVLSVLCGVLIPLVLSWRLEYRSRYRFLLQVRSAVDGPHAAACRSLIQCIHRGRRSGTLSPPAHQAMQQQATRPLPLPMQIRRGGRGRDGWGPKDALFRDWLAISLLCAHWALDTATVMLLASYLIMACGAGRPLALAAQLPALAAVLVINFRQYLF